MTVTWGDDSWQDELLRQEPGLFEEIKIKKKNESIADRFRNRLITVAGFKFVPKPIPMKNSSGGDIYYLYFGSHNKTGKKIVSEIFNKYDNNY